LSVWSPMILIEFLLAPTVPSAPSPQNLQATMLSGAVTGVSPLSRDKLVTSSTIDNVNSFLSTFSNVAMISAGVVSLEPNP